VAGISDASRRGLKEVLKYELMTQVQAQTLPVIISGEDVLAKAKTGTGKTLGFLVPIVEVVLAARARGFGADNVGALILSPTRELSMQIAAEAAKLLHFQKSVGVQVVIGGVNMKTQLRRMNTQRLDIMVATPGRLIDHLQNSPGILNRLRNIRVRCSYRAVLPHRFACIGGGAHGASAFRVTPCRCCALTSATRCLRWASARL